MVRRREYMSEVTEFDGATPGSHISDVCRKAVVAAEKRKNPVHFEFNGTDVIVQPGEPADTVEARWRADYEAEAKAYREHPDRAKEAEERRRREEAERKAVMVNSAKSEEEMREAEVPWPKTPKQLNEYIASLVKREHDYGTCVYAMSMAAVAAFNYVAGELEVTGFQSGCADMDVIRRTRRMKGPFMVIDGENALYPQYDLREKLNKTLDEWGPWLKEQAAKKLLEPGVVHPAVKAHWEKLAGAGDIRESLLGDKA
jgi:hypothetical protein